VIKIGFWNRKRELQISTYSEKVIHRELSNQTVGEKREMPKVDSETATIVSLAGTAKQGRATHELSHNVSCFCSLYFFMFPTISLRHKSTKLIPFKQKQCS